MDKKSSPLLPFFARRLWRLVCVALALASFRFAVFALTNLFIFVPSTFIILVLRIVVFPVGVFLVDIFAALLFLFFLPRNVSFLFFSALFLEQLTLSMRLLLLL